MPCLLVPGYAADKVVWACGEANGLGNSGGGFLPIALNGKGRHWQRRLYLNTTMLA